MCYATSLLNFGLTIQIRRKLWNCRKSTRCPHATSTQYFHPMLEDTERVCTKCPNSRGYVANVFFCVLFYGVVNNRTVDPPNKSQRILTMGDITHCCIIQLRTVRLHTLPLIKTTRNHHLQRCVIILRRKRLEPCLFVTTRGWHLNQAQF